MKLDETFKPVISLKEQRFAIWKILIANKDSSDLLLTFSDGEKKYACIEFQKLLDLLYSTPDGISELSGSSQVKENCSV